MATKQLARELRLLRKRSLSVVSPQQSTKRQRDDFESTCWDNDRTSPQEIIEFPAIVLNTRTGKIESEFHYFLQPTERSTLSDFCQNLTGITQHQVDNGIPLSLCLRKFAAWLRKLREDKGIVCSGDSSTPAAKSNTGQGGTAALVTWSDWDLGVCLLYETRRKQITKPPSLNEWIDLRATYKAFYGRKPDGLNGALMELGIKFDGRQHSGLDDARNTARLAWQMIRDGCVMTITKSLKMSSTGRIERLSFPLSGPVYSGIQSPRQTSGHSNHEHEIKGYTKARTLFSIAQDEVKTEKMNAGVNQEKWNVLHVGTDQGTIKDESSKTNQQTRKGLSEKNLNVLTTVNNSAVKKLASSRREDLSDVSKSNLKNKPTFDKIIAKQEALSGNNSNKQKKSPSKIPVLTAESRIMNSNVHQQYRLVNKLCPDHILAPKTQEVRTDIVPIKSSVCECKHAFSISSQSRLPRPTSSLPLQELAAAVSSPGMQRLNTDSVCRTREQQELEELPILSPTHLTKQTSASSSLELSLVTRPSAASSGLTEASFLNASANIELKKASVISPSSLQLSTSIPFKKTTGVNSQTASFATATTSFRTPTTSFKIPTTSFKTPVTSYKTPTTSLKTPASSLKIPASSLKIPATTLKMPTTSFKTPTTSFKTPASSLKTPATSFKTPTNSYKTPNVLSSSMNITPPLCSCGRRAKCRLVQNQGPNTGRWFFSCSAGNYKNSGCKFFQWASLT